MNTFLVAIGIFYLIAFPAFWFAMRSAWSPPDKPHEALAGNVVKLDDYRAAANQHDAAP